MKLLLDTHVLIWAVAEPHRISLAGRKLLADPRNEICFSVACLLEIASKNGAGRRSAPGISADAVFRLASRANYRLIDIKPQHAIEVETTALFHGDPIDRLLLVQAKLEGLRLMTHDTALAGYGANAILV